MSTRLRAGAALLLALAPAAAQDPPHHAPPVRVQHRLHVRLDPAERQLQVADEMTVDGAGIIALALGAQFALQEATLDGRALPAPIRTQSEQRWSIDLGALGAHRLALRYGGELAPLMPTDHRGTLEEMPPMASPRGSYLPAGSGWIAQLGDLPFEYRLQLELAPGQRGLVPGQLSEEQDSAQGYRALFTTAHPFEGIDLFAAPYVVVERWLERDGGEPIRLRTWFHPEIADLSASYLAALERYFTLYEGWIGDYPFGEFSVVSSPLPTGFGMPTLTYLGVDVLKLPFIKSTSLGHEVLHNWWGNGVYVDYATGNWAEGLTTFMADYTYKEQAGPEAARGLRLDWLRDFAAVPPGQDQPLRVFTARTHGTSQIVGYDKAAFVFLMLRDGLGEMAFKAGVQRFWREQRFRRAGWADLQRAFEHTSGQALGDFFDQWLTRSGAPRLRIEHAQLDRDGADFVVRVRLVQTQPAYALRVPLVLDSEAGAEVHMVQLDAQRQSFDLRSASRPRALQLDPELRLFRRLDDGELPPILRQVMLDPNALTVVPADDPEIQAQAQALSARLMDHAPRLRRTLPDRETPVLLIGAHREVDAFLATNGLPARPPQVSGNGTAQIWTARQRNGATLAVVSVDGREALAALMRALPHYGRQSWLVFQGTQAIDRGVWPSQAMSWRFDR